MLFLRVSLSLRLRPPLSIPPFLVHLRIMLDRTRDDIYCDFQF